MPCAIAEDCRQIAVRQIAEEGMALVLRWQDEGGQPAAVAVAVRTGERVTIGYRWRQDGAWRSARQDVALCAIRTPIGGVYWQWPVSGSAGGTRASCTTL